MAVTETKSRIDQSALARLAQSSDPDLWSNRIERGLVHISNVTRLEIGYSASDIARREFRDKDFDTIAAITGQPSTRWRTQARPTDPASCGCRRRHAIGGYQYAARHLVTPRFLNELHPGGQAELGVNVGEVGLHGARRDEKARANVFVAQPFTH